MAAAAACGQRVVCVSATAGELGTSDPATWPPERLARVRRWEAAAAMAILGVTDHRWLGYADGGLAGLRPDGAFNSLQIGLARQPVIRNSETEASRTQQQTPVRRAVDRPATMVT